MWSSNEINPCPKGKKDGGCSCRRATWGPLLALLVFGADLFIWTISFPVAQLETFDALDGRWYLRVRRLAIVIAAEKLNCRGGERLRCPKFKKIIVTGNTPVLSVKIIDPPAEFADIVPPVKRP
jgi:hypothetical protein